MIPDTFRLIGNSSGVGNAARRSLSVVVVCAVGCGVCRGMDDKHWSWTFFLDGKCSINVSWKTNRMNEWINEPIPLCKGKKASPWPHGVYALGEKPSHCFVIVNLPVPDMVGARWRNGSQGSISETAPLVVDFAESLGVCPVDEGRTGEGKHCVVKGSEIPKSLGLLEMGVLMAPNEGHKGNMF